MNMQPAAVSFLPSYQYFLPLMQILECPRTGGHLTLSAFEDVLALLSPRQVSQIPDGTSAFLVSAEAKVAYPIRGLICSFLSSEEIHIDGKIPSGTVTRDDEIKRSVKRFYDDHGWQPNEAGIYHDTADHSDIDCGAYRLYEIETNLALLKNLMQGEFMLDAASGAIAMAEYLSYSWFFKHRVCVDLSYTALQQASQKLGTSGFYVLADICRLPFRADVFDGIVSGYTIQHIPYEQQETAVAELYRVLRPGKCANIVTAVGEQWFRAFSLKVWHVFRKPRCLPFPEGKRLYIAAHKRKWWYQVGKRLGANVHAKSFRLLAKREFEILFRNSHRIMYLIHAVETIFPKVSAWFAALLWVELKKPATPPRL